MRYMCVIIYACAHDRGVEIVYRQRKLVIVIIECLGYMKTTAQRKEQRKE